MAKTTILLVIAALIFLSIIAGFIIQQLKFDKKSDNMWKQHKENKHRNKCKVWGNDR